MLMPVGICLSCQVRWGRVQANGEVTVCFTRFEMAACAHIVVVRTSSQQAIGGIQIIRNLDAAGGAGKSQLAIILVYVDDL